MYIFFLRFLWSPFPFGNKDVMLCRGIILIPVKCFIKALKIYRLAKQYVAIKCR